MTDNPLVRIPVITQAILDAQPLEFHADNIGKLGAYLRYLSGKLDATIELKNNAAEAQLRICRNAGLRFPDIVRRGGDGSNQHGSKEQMVARKPLAAYGFKKHRANICRKIATIPEDLFENEIMTIRTTEHLTGREITIAYFIDKVAAVALRSADRSQERLSIPLDDPHRAAQLIRARMTPGNISQLITDLSEGSNHND